MAVLSRKALLALEAVIDVALHARPNPVQARDITARQGVPQRYLEQIMQALVRAKILRGVRGPQGGYRLARERRRIKVLDIIDVIEPLKDMSDKDYSALGKQIIAPFHSTLCATMAKAIGETTIDDLCLAYENTNHKDTLDKNDNNIKDKSDFSI